jgi:uncharacterized protein
MKKPLLPRLFSTLLVGLLCMHGGEALSQGRQQASRYEDQKRGTNENTVSVMGSQAATSYTRFSEDMQNVLDESEANGLRVLPILGKGGISNLNDILFLKGVDMGIVEQDVLSYAKRKDPTLYANLDQRINYILKLGNSELHIFANAQINHLEDLRGKKVSFYKEGSSSAIAAETLFQTCNVPVQPVYLDTDLAASQLKAGEIAATLRISSAPHGAFNPYVAADGHFLPIDDAHLPRGCFAKLLEFYIPTFLKREQYPKILTDVEKVPTLANSTILACYSWPQNTDRYRRMALFTKKLYDNIDKLRDGPRHPAWKQVNLTANMPGWTRFKPAQEWVDAHRDASNGADDVKKTFDTFVEEYTKNTGIKKLSPADKAALFAEFSKTLATKRGPAAAADNK